ncbi:uncharacterized protein LOC124172866 isoform X2 [Ischnura elegans]|uniref:uncharacterized protein LOC124172866 isoform X2 n=1 Tax=Ischnura elegans TaxID=197161 RepID=UPI001ED8B760|nr:uncharacterized protein LOC124172866 isoform X2 [Ischnura elegans]
MTQEEGSIPNPSQLRRQVSSRMDDHDSDHLLQPIVPVGAATGGPGTQPEGGRVVKKPSRRHRANRECHPYQEGLEPSAACGKDYFISTLYMLKDLLKQERLLCRCSGQIQDPVFKFLIEVLEKLELAVENPSTAMDRDLIPVEKVKFLELQWNKMSPLESNHLRTVLFVMLSQLQRATLTIWRAEESPSPEVQVREIVQKLLVFVSTTRSDLESILNLQRGVANVMWRLNHVHKVSKRTPVDSDLRVSLDRLSLDLMQLNNAMLSSSLEQRVVLWPSLEYYAQGRGSNPVHLRRGNSEVGSQASTTLSRMSSVSVEVFANNEDVYGPFLRDYVRDLKGVKVVHLALNEILLEQQEWADIVSSQLTSFGGGDSADTGTESIGSILKEGLSTTSSLLGLGTDAGVMHQDDGDETCSMFRIESLDEEKFRDAVDVGIIGTVNQLVSLNCTLSRLRWSLVKFIKDNVQASESEDVAEQDEDTPYASYFLYKDCYIFKEEEEWKPPSRTGVIAKGRYPNQVGRGLKGIEDIVAISQDGGVPWSRTGRDGDDKGMGHLTKDGDVTGKDKMAMFLQKFRGQIRVITDRVRARDYRTLRLGDAAFRIDKLVDSALSQSRNRGEFWDRVLEDREAFEERLKEAYNPGEGGLWRRNLPLPIDCLLFEGEKDALRELARSPAEGGSILENLDRVTQDVSGGRETWGARYVRGFPRPPEAGKMTTPLEEATLTLRRSNLPRDKLRAGIIDVGLLMIFPVLYLADIVSDFYMAYRHLIQNNYLNFALTILFVFGPMVAEIISKFVVKLKGSEEGLLWKNVFSIEILRLLPRAHRSLRHALDSRKQFDKDLSVFYSELNRLRGVRFEGLSCAPSASSLRRRPTVTAPWNPRCETSLIQVHSYTMMVTNEKQLFHWKMVDTLNESAPQLLLQLVIVNVHLVNGETVGHWSIMGILASLACFSWTLHLCHYYMHYDGLKNNFKLPDRATDFLAHFLIVCGRFMAISCVAALHPIWFLVVAFFYLGFRFIYLYRFSSSRWAYRLITRNYLTVLWPVHRLFITPYILRIWRIDALDDVIYHMETFVLALSWVYLLDGGHPLGHYRWTITATILILNFVFLPLILKYNETRHDPSRFCKEDDPFWLGKYLGKKLEGGKSSEDTSGLIKNKSSHARLGRLNV